jgi:methylated-DNA-[protein]-cysteine S-methyltransferase
MKYYFKNIKTPVGLLKLVASEVGLMAILWQDDKPDRVKLPQDLLSGENEFIRQAEKQLADYFSGKTKTFSLPFDFHGTEFQKRVWQALLEIPYGETRSYGELAKAIRRPSASRAVGAANGKNPLSIVVPCHRVIGSNGKLTGLPGGLEVKHRLLELERS